MRDRGCQVIAIVAFMLLVNSQEIEGVSICILGGCKIIAQAQRAVMLHSENLNSNKQTLVQQGHFLHNFLALPPSYLFVWPVSPFLYHCCPFPCPKSQCKLNCIKLRRCTIYTVVQIFQKLDRFVGWSVVFLTRAKHFAGIYSLCLPLRISTETRGYLELF